MLAKALYESFSGDFDIANSELYLPYDLYLKHLTNPEKVEERKKHPEKHKRQGIYVGMLDNLAEALIVHDTDGTHRIMSFGKFEREYFPNRQAKKPFDNPVDLFLNFHPKTRPILWRILIAQAYLYQAIKNCRSTHYSGMINDPDMLKKMLLIEPKLFDWRQKKEEEEMDDQIFQPLQAAENYLIGTLNQIIDRARYWD